MYSSIYSSTIVCTVKKYTIFKLTGFIKTEEGTRGFNKLR